MNNRPLVSIIVATYNMASELESCLDRVTAFSQQTSLEVIVIDGGSQDYTRKILRKHNQLLSYWISEPDQGVYDAFHKGIKQAQGRFIYFLGADDRLLHGFTAACSLLSDSHTVYYGNVKMEESGKLYDGSFSIMKLARTNICQQAIFYPRSVFDHYAFSMRYPIQADWYLNMQLAKDSVFTFQYMDETIASFAQSGMSSCSADISFNTEYLTLVKECFSPTIYLQRALIIKTASILKHLLPQSVINKLNSLPIRP